MLTHFCPNLIINVKVLLIIHNDDRRNDDHSSKNSLKIILDWKKRREGKRFYVISRCHLLVCRFLLRDFIFPSNLRPYLYVMCTHARGLLYRLEGRKYGVHLGMNYDRDFSSSGSLRESHRSAKLVVMSIARLSAKKVWLSRRNHRKITMATIEKFINFKRPKNMTIFRGL